MKVKWNGTTITVENESGNPKNEFYCYWNDYYIAADIDDYAKRVLKKKQYAANCFDPNGVALVDAGSFNTIKEAVQCCFDNIKYPLVKIGEDYSEDDDEE